jgi:hypothetical protein
MEKYRILEALLGKYPSTVDWNESEAGIEALIEDTINLKVYSYTGSIQEYSLNQFEFSVIKTAHQGERQFSSIRLSGSNTNTLGYLFPIASLRTGKEITQNKWPLLYAAAAIRAIFIEGIANDLIVFPDLASTNLEFEITDLFPNDLAIMVVGKEQLNKAKSTLDSLKLMIQANGYSLYPEKDDLNQPEASPEFDEKIKLKPLAEPLLSECPELLWIISSAKREESLSAKFLTLYQVIEHFISRVFHKYMEEISKSSAFENNPWLLRKKITDVVAEKWRLNRLQSCFLKGYDAEIFKECMKRCDNLLVSLGEVSPEENNKPSWSNSLYKVRNILIHRQVSLFSKKDIRSSLSEICEILFDVCFEILAHYSEEEIIPLVSSARSDESTLSSSNSGDTSSENNFSDLSLESAN